MSKVMNNKKILFFEWSDINRQPIEFNRKNDYLEFCNRSNIKVSKKNHNFLNTNDTVYCTCKAGKNELIMSGDYHNFRKNFSKHRNG